jgi:hypothetical protein
VGIGTDGNPLHLPLKGELEYITLLETSKKYQLLTEIPKVHLGVLQEDHTGNYHGLQILMVMELLKEVHRDRLFSITVVKSLEHLREGVLIATRQPHLTYMEKCHTIGPQMATQTMKNSSLG